MKKLLFVMLLLTTQLVLGEEKTMSLVCDGVSESTLDDQHLTNSENMTFVFEGGSLTSSRKFNKPTLCLWSKSSIECHGDLFYPVTDGSTMEGKYQVDIDRVSGKVIYSQTLGKLLDTFKGDCKKGSQKF